ncbi:non-hydrolyzing UDP-N-acetylglucosamine 2-epimerase [Nitrosomonas communis]|uniref:non-hydrolyzing UDP-N-acetylglucosamine 2-epimerase n=1 Tax=Nitrosomonas communis TaxID=44574 RepID=UPI0026ED0B5E|nr:UDP-N-acetylglucosamine 2-epimerase (non-hydrolyzing) [Nitrosomonas communis]MCO6427294.1 UDP-N-acetylglucosamine 2-epimerase (non-hydrolyzing) [Nitrosomonas communis]
MNTDNDKKIICVVGTRPEAIKMAPVIQALKNEPWVDLRVLATAQHRHLLDQVLNVFGIEPDIDLNIMRPNQALTTLTARLLLDLDDVLLAEKPDAVLVQGDTTTVLAVALACFYQGIPVGHVEAGLRTWNINNPFPEEANRVITGKLAHWHFVPTEGSRHNLLREGVADEKIFITGNTVIDALLTIAARNITLPLQIEPDRRLVLITAHRRENFGEPLRHICLAIQALAQKNPDVDFLFPVHPNPNVTDIVNKLLANKPNIHLSAPLDYVHFVAALKRSYLILTDSGGIQEEAPALGKPVLVLRDETERPEAIEQGVAKLVGTHVDHIMQATQHLLDDTTIYQAMAKGISPYGDGHAAERIVNVLKEHFS